MLYISDSRTLFVNIYTLYDCNILISPLRVYKLSTNVLRNLDMELLALMALVRGHESLTVIFQVMLTLGFFDWRCINLF